MDSTKKSDFLKYLGTASILNLFSISPQLYRYLGNAFGNKKRIRIGLPHYYGDRAKCFISLCNKYNALQNGDKVIEFGTGWVHFESVVLKLFYDIDATLFDVWDNRQFDALKIYSLGLEKQIYNKFTLTTIQRARIQKIIRTILKAKSLSELYKLLDFNYTLCSSGALRQFKDESFHMIFSYNVLEHIDLNMVESRVSDFFRIIKPGGYSLHMINFSDHLVSFARLKDMPIKNYLKYSDRKWKFFFENKVQYFNRLQRPVWLEAFKKAGFILLEEQLDFCNLNDVRVHPMYDSFEKKDLECESMVVMHRKPF